MWYIYILYDIYIYIWVSSQYHNECVEWLKEGFQRPNVILLCFFLANFRCTYRSGSSGITQLLVDVDHPGQAFVSVWPRPPTTRIKVAAQKQAKSWDHSLQLYWARHGAVIKGVCPSSPDSSQVVVLKERGCTEQWWRHVAISMCVAGREEG